MMLRNLSRLGVSSAKWTKSTSSWRSVYTRAQLDKMSLSEWESAFKKETIDVAKMDVATISYDESAARMRRLLKSGVLQHDDILRKPERFFLAHKLLAFHSPQLGPGFWIRFTVHYNLCVGTILGLGNASQVEKVLDWQPNGKLGCFSLTEKFAGVNSGMIVNTIAEYDPSKKVFRLHTPSHGAKKNWISQGLVADKTAVIADLHINGKSYGPHGFMIDLRDDAGNVIPGVSHGDMGRKTIGNDLDNAWIGFDHVEIPKENLLTRFCEVEDDGTYVQKVKGLPVFHMIGQRLFTGRVAVAQAALQFTTRLFEMTREYADNKMCWSPSGAEVPLSSLPQLQHLYADFEESRARLTEFVDKCERDLGALLKEDKIPSLELVEAIAVAKVKTIEETIELTHRLKNEVGSYALMADTGFGQADFLQCCKFAEGDSRILMQKMARDRMKVFSKKEGANLPATADPSWDAETTKCFELQQAIVQETKRNGGDKLKAWDTNWKLVYELADVYMKRVMTEFVKN